MKPRTGYLVVNGRYVKAFVASPAWYIGAFGAYGPSTPPPASQATSQPKEAHTMAAKSTQEKVAEATETAEAAVASTKGKAKTPVATQPAPTAPQGSEGTQEHRTRQRRRSRQAPEAQGRGNGSEGTCRTPPQAPRCSPQPQRVRSRRGTPQEGEAGQGCQARRRCSCQGQVQDQVVRRRQPASRGGLARGLLCTSKRFSGFANKGPCTLIPVALRLT
jgi:hypothetical protein